MAVPKSLNDPGLLFKKRKCRKLKCMLPVKAYRRKPSSEACWNGFWMTDAELEKLVRDIMTDYRQYQPQ